MPNKARALAEAPDLVQTPLPDRQKVAAVDFYGALQRSLDAAQRQLSSSDNGFADFVVKEFKVDAAVRLQMSALGVLQFVLADETMSADTVSRVSLTLAAVAKPDGQTAPRNVAQLDLTALSDLSWLPPALVEQLAKHEIRTVSEFLGMVADARLFTQIVPLLGNRAADIQQWAERMRRDVSKRP